MKIAVDYTLATQHIGGMGVYVRNIIDNLKKIDKKNKYILYVNRSPLSATNKFKKLIEFVREQLWYQFGALKLYNKKVADISFFPNPPVPLLINTPMILTIADMSFYFDDTMPRFTRFYLYLIYLLAAKKAKVITTFSEYSKSDIVKLLKINPNKIKIVPLAVSPKFKPSKDNSYMTKFVKKFGITKPYIICSPGTFLKRKNVDDLILAYSKLPRRIKERLQILLVGKPFGEAYQKTKKLIQKLELNDSIVFAGYVKPESKELIGLYSNAEMFVYPSLYEGFGLPPLEAMSCGLPVIVYNKTSLPEVVGNAALIVENRNQLTHAITNILTSKRLKKELINKGFERVKYFSWKNSADILRRIILVLNSS